jgi:hypothetical protein
VNRPVAASGTIKYYLVIELITPEFFHMHILEKACSFLKTS